MAHDSISQFLAERKANFFVDTNKKQFEKSLNYRSRDYHKNKLKKNLLDYENKAWHNLFPSDYYMFCILFITLGCNEARLRNLSLKAKRHIERNPEKSLFEIAEDLYKGTRLKPIKSKLSNLKLKKLINPIN